MTANDLLAEAFAPLIGRFAWGAMKGVGTMFTLEFGEPRLEVREPVDPIRSTSKRGRRSLSQRRVWVRGEWHLWISSSLWHLSLDGRKAAWSESSHMAMRRALIDLEGRKLLAVTLDEIARTTSFTFERDAVLQTRPWEDDLEQWLLFDRGGFVLACLPDGRLSTDET